jgi:dolichyl-phosphate beta-glucosyltransferase
MSRPFRSAELLTLVLIVSVVYLSWTHFASTTTLYDLIHPPPSDRRHLSFFIEPSPELGNPLPFPSVFDPPELFATFVLLATERLLQNMPLLKTMILYLQNRQSENESFTFEIILIADQASVGAFLVFAAKYKEVRVMRHPTSFGAGADIAAGCLHARGRFVVAIDGIPKVEELRRFETALLSGNGVVVGVPTSSPLGSNFFTQSLNFLMDRVRQSSRLVVAFSREAARWIVPNQHVYHRMLIDEVHIIARKVGIRRAEIPIEWASRSPDKASLLEMVRVTLDLLRISLCYNTGIWSVEQRNSV